MKRAEKGQIIDSVKQTLEKSSIVVVSHYRGLTVDEINTLRAQLRGAGSGMRVVKNTLARLALKDTPFEGVTEFLSGPTALAYSDDPVGPCKVLTEFAKKHDKLVVLGGMMEGDVLKPADIDKLSKLPSRELLVAKMLGTMQAPLTNLVQVLNAVPGGLARALDQIRSKKEEESA